MLSMAAPTAAAKDAEDHARKTAAPLICPCLVGRKDLMTKFYPAAVGDTANAGSDKVFVGKMVQA